MAIAERALRGGLGRPRAARPPHRQDGRGRRLRPGRAGGGRRAQPLRPHGHRLRARRGSRRPDALRRAGRQAREADHRPARRRSSSRRGSSSSTTSTSGRDVTAEELRERHDALVVCDRLARLARPRRARPRAAKASTSRWTTSTSATAGSPPRRAARRGRPRRARRSAPTGKRVIVIGGGDTGMDCISNSHREGARSVIMLDVYAELPPTARDPRHPWPLPPKRTPTTYALDEGGKRRWGTEVTGFGGKDGARQPRLRAPGHRHLVARSHAGARQRVRARGRPGADRDRLRAPRARGSRRAARARARPPRQHPDRA